MKQADCQIPEYQPIYHDTFKECFEELNQMREVVGNRAKVVGIYRISRYIRCEVDGGINLFDENKKDFVFENTVEDILCPFNGPQFLVIKGETSALYNENGKQMSDFVNGHWDWEWVRGSKFNRRIYNNESGLDFVFPS